MINPQIVCSDGENINIPLNIFNKIKNNNNNDNDNDNDNNNNNYIINLSDKYFCDLDTLKKILKYLKKELSESQKQSFESKNKEIDKDRKKSIENLDILLKEKTFLNQQLNINIGNPLEKLIIGELEKINSKENKILGKLKNIEKRKNLLNKEYYYNKIFDFKNLNTRQICYILCCAEVLELDEIINNYIENNKINDLLLGMIEYYNKDLFNKITNINRLNIHSASYGINYNNMINNITNNSNTNNSNTDNEQYYII